MEFLFSHFPQSFGFSVYGTNTIFFTVFFIGGMEGLFLVSSAVDVVATPMISSLLHVLSSLVSSFTDKGSLHLECTLSLLLIVDTDFSLSLSTLLNVVCVEVPLLLSESEFCFQKILATLLFND